MPTVRANRAGYVSKGLCVWRAGTTDTRREGNAGGFKELDEQVGVRGWAVGNKLHRMGWEAEGQGGEGREGPDEDLT